MGSFCFIASMKRYLGWYRKSRLTSTGATIFNLKKVNLQHSLRAPFKTIFFPERPMRIWISSVSLTNNLFLIYYILPFKQVMLHFQSKWCSKTKTKQKWKSYFPISMCYHGKDEQTKPPLEGKRILAMYWPMKVLVS